VVAYLDRYSTNIPQLNENTSTFPSKLLSLKFITRSLAPLKTFPSYRGTMMAVLASMRAAEEQGTLKTVIRRLAKKEM